VESFTDDASQANIIDSYDQLPYPHISHTFSHPEYLASLATLYGLTPPKVSSSRILEIGCSTGGNLLPISVVYPDAYCLGIDISDRQIEIGRNIASQMDRPGNIELKAMDIARFDKSFGRFDYIIAHGIFSWVPDPVQEKILSILNTHLSPYGVAYISYNTYPGWHTKIISRELMLRSSKGHATCKEKAQISRQVLQTFSETAIHTDEYPYASFFKHVNEDIRQKPDFYLYHDYLEENNTPLYFSDFIEKIRGKGLHYVGDTQPHLMTLKLYPKNVQDAISGIAKDRIEVEQYIDFLISTSLRRSVLVRADQQVSDHIIPSNIISLHIKSAIIAIKEENQTLNDDQSMKFLLKSPIHPEIDVNRPITKAALKVLYESQPEGKTFEALARAAYAILGLDPETLPQETLQENLITLCLDLSDAFSYGALILRTSPVPCIRNSGEFPKAAPLPLVQASNGQHHLTNHYHESIPLPPWKMDFFTHLDGKHHRDQLLDVILRLIETGKLTVDSPQPTTGGIFEPNRTEARHIVDQTLSEFSSLSLMVA